MFGKILIANRGEIACRVIRTARRLGIQTVAVYSDADRGALHVRLADEAVHIGPAPARESYLNGKAILAAAQRTGAEAIHPGYGFLSENDRFAQACRDAGIIFVGPPPEAIRAMGDKARAKALMAQAGVPLTPGYHGAEQSDERLMAEAERIGYPVLIKAAAGGGGKGMRRVDHPKEFLPALAACRREAAAAFGDDRVLLERYILEPRHVEMQMAVAKGLYEMGCSEISLGDTIGVGTPAAISRLIETVAHDVPIAQLAGHFHDTYGMAVANVVAAWQMGVATFDASVGGLGGCPYAPGAAGNVPTEALVYLFNQMGVTTGVALAPLVETAWWIAEVLGRPPQSRVALAWRAKAQRADAR